MEYKNEKLVDTQYRNWISTLQKLTLLDKLYKYSPAGKREYRWWHYPFSDGKRNLMARVGIHLDAWSIDNELTLSRVVSLFLSFSFALYLSTMPPVRSVLVPFRMDQEKQRPFTRKNFTLSTMFLSMQTWYERHSIST